MRPNGVKANVVARLSRDLLVALQYMGMEFCYVRRDTKPASILVHRQPLAAILGDSGAARYVPPITASHEGGLPHDICTMWYRAPEVLITQTRYYFQASYGQLALPWQN